LFTTPGASFNDGRKIDHQNYSIQLPNIWQGHLAFPGVQGGMEPDPVSQLKAEVGVPLDDQQTTQLQEQHTDPTQMQAPATASQPMGMEDPKVMADSAPGSSNFPPASAPPGHYQAVLQRLLDNPEAGEQPTLHVQLPKAPELVSMSEIGQTETLATAAAAAGAQQHMMDPMVFHQMQMMHQAQLQEAARPQEHVAAEGALEAERVPGIPLGDMPGGLAVAAQWCCVRCCYHDMP
jgi:hypothetical protein